MLSCPDSSTISTKAQFGPGSVYSVDDLRAVKSLFGRLVGLGVVLTMTPEGRLAFDAPAGVLGGDLLDAMRAHRDELLNLVEQFEERAAVREYDGGLSRADAERLALADVMGD